MATTAASSYVASTVMARVNVAETFVYGEYEIGAALVVNDVIQMVKIPSGARVLDVVLGVDDLDTGTQLVLAVGDGTTADRFVTGSTIGQTGGVVRTNQGAGVGYRYSADDTIDVKVTTAPQTGATSGTLSLAVFYTMN